MRASAHRMTHTVAAEDLLELRPLLGQLPLELVLPGRVRFGRQSVVGESRLIGDLGDAERGDDQVGDRSAAFRFGDDQRGVRTAEHVDVPPVLIVISRAISQQRYSSSSPNVSSFPQICNTESADV